MNKFFVALIFAVTPSLAHAQGVSGADMLLKSVNGSVGEVEAHIAPPKQNQSVVVQEEIKINNPVARQLFADWSPQHRLSYEMNSWVKAFFADQFEGFAHLKTVMDKQVALQSSASFRESVEGAYLYSLYKMGLTQSFVNSLLNQMERESFVKSSASQVLVDVLKQENLDQWLMKQSIQFTPQQTNIVSRLASSSKAESVWSTLAAYTHLRKGLAAEPYLSKLPVGSPLRARLATTVALAYAKKGDLGQAAKVLKFNQDPYVNGSANAQDKADYSITIARFLYQAGSLDGAIQFYSEIPKGSSQYLVAQEEMAWALLREGKQDRLRGVLSTLTSSVVSDKFLPESYLVKSISDLKLCYYAEVERDFQNFLKIYTPWASKIESAIQSTDSLPPRQVDLYSQEASAAVDARSSEIAKLEQISIRSISAVLPAVGPQLHWKQAIQSLQRNLELAKKARADEYRRQWKNDKYALREAIRKMQFVKVELLSQVGQNDKLTAGDDAFKSKSQAVLEQKKKEVSANAEQTYPFDGVTWSDELFKLRSTANGKCVGQL